MTKDLIRGFLLAHNAPGEILNALAMLPTHIADFEPLPKDENLDLWPMSVRTSNCLRCTGIRTKSQLLSLSEGQLLVIPNFGRKSLSELRELIKPLRFADPRKSVGLIRNPAGGGYCYPGSEAA